MSISGISSFRGLRKKHIEQGVLLLKGFLIVASLLSVLFVCREILTRRLETHAAIDKLENELSETSDAPPSSSSGVTTAKDYSIILDRNILGPLTPPSTGPTPAANKPVSKIPLNLIGTFLAAKEAPFAIIEDQRKGAQEVFNIHDSVFGEAKLVAVFRDRVEIDRNGVIEVLKLEESEKNKGSASANTGSAGSGEEIQVAETDVDNALANLPLLLTEIRAVPYFKDGQATGLRLFAIKTGSLFDKIGLKNGDILKTINGTQLGDFTQAVKLFERLKSERTIKVAIERNREDKEVTYQIQ